MDKIKGRSWLDFFNYSNIGDIKEFLDSLVTYSFYLRSLSIKKQSVKKETLVKLSSLFAASKYSDFIGFLRQKLDDPEICFGIIPTGFCHGDLTLSNMIFKGKEIYLIDFLDSFVESYWIDIIKLRQDCFYKWCLIYNGIDSARYHIILNKLNDLLVYHFKDEINNPTFQLLEAINILRIEPYIPKEKKHIIQLMLNQNLIYVGWKKEYRN